MYKTFKYIKGGNAVQLIVAANRLDQRIKAQYKEGELNGVMRQSDLDEHPFAVYKGNVIAVCIDDPGVIEADLIALANAEGFVSATVPDEVREAVEEAVLV